MEQFYRITVCVLFAAVGLCVGSFLNVVVYRLPRGMNLAKPASHCPSCKHPLAWYDNIPLLSYLLLGGKCRYCGVRITPRYFFLELTNCALWLACALAFARSSVWHALFCASALSVLLSMAQCDIENMFIPDGLQAALTIAALGAAAADPVTPWAEKFYGLLLGGGFFAAFYGLSYPLFGREGLGFGDVKLMAGAGLLLGWRATCVCIVFAIMYALAGIAARRAFFPRVQRALPGMPEGAAPDEFAFAPYLALGALTALFFGNFAAAWYAALLAVA